MKKPIFNDGRIAPLEDLYSSISTCSINNLKETMRCVVKSTGMVVSGDAFAAYIDNDMLIVPIGSILFGNYELFSPTEATTMSVKIQSSSYNKTMHLIATLTYEQVFPYPAFPGPGSISRETTLNTLSIPAIKLSLEEFWEPTDDTVQIGELVYDGGKITYIDKRRFNTLSLVNPPNVVMRMPSISLDSPHIYQLPNIEAFAGDYSKKPDPRSFVKLSWNIPEGMSSLQYFGIDLIPVIENIEKPKYKVSTQYFPNPDEIDAKGPSPKAFVSIRCIPGLKYKAYLYGYFSRLALARKLLDSISFSVAGEDIAPNNYLNVDIIDLVPSGISLQIDTDYTGTNNIQVFIKKSTSTTTTTDKNNLYYEGPPVPIIYSENSDTYILVRIIDKYNTVVSSSNEILHRLPTAATPISVREEQLTFAIPCTVDPTSTTSASVLIASFTAPYSFKITKGIFYITRNKEADPISLVDGKINVKDDGASIYTFSYSTDSETSKCKLGSSTSLSPSVVAKNSVITIFAEADTSGNINPYYGVVELYVKKVMV